MFLKNKKQRFKNRHFLAKSLVLLMVVILFVVGYSMPQDVTIYSPESFYKLSSDWVQITSDGAMSLDDIDQFTNADPGVPIVIQRTITSDMVDQCVLFYAEHQSVLATMDGQGVYSLTCDGAAELFETPGRTWVNIPITADMVGQALEISFMSVFPVYQGLPSTIYCVQEKLIFMVQVYSLLLRNTAAFVMLCLAFISYVHAAFWRHHTLRRFLLTAADVYLFVGLWLCAEINVLAIWGGRALLSSVMAMIFLRIIPIAIYHFFAALLPYATWRTKLAGKIVWGNLVLSLVAQFVFSFSMLHLVPLNMVVIIGCCILGLLEVFDYHHSGMQFVTFQYACYSANILFVAILIECYIYWHYQSHGHWTGIPLSLSCFLYYIITYLSLISEQSVTMQKKQKLEQAIANINKRPLNQQINSHFLYNTLNTIGSFCKEDSDRAYDAIGLLGKYMRAYTYLINADDYVALEEELDLMHTYIAIQNMRFDNTIQFTVDNTCDEVLLPPLTLQPLVENAIHHGIRKSMQGGEIIITARCKYNMAEITVADCGAGFDTNAPPKTNGIGLENLKRRITAMGGTLSIHSAPGVGTCVTLMVPIQQPDMEERNFERFICR